MTTADQHQLRILKDTVRNPFKGLLGGPTAEEAEEILLNKFKMSQKAIDNLKA